jgi:hypothetical protein
MRMSAISLSALALSGAIRLAPIDEAEHQEQAKRRAQERADAEIMRQQQEHSCGHIGKATDYYRKRNVPKKLRKKP